MSARGTGDCQKSKPQQVEDLKLDFQAPSPSPHGMAASVISRAVLRVKGTWPEGKRYEKEEASWLMDLPKASCACSSSSQQCNALWDSTWQYCSFVPLSCMGHVRREGRMVLSPLSLLNPPSKYIRLSAGSLWLYGQIHELVFPPDFH